MASAYLDNIIAQLENNQYLSPLTDKDEKLYRTYITAQDTYIENKLNINFEDSFEYIRMYFNSGRYQGFKYFDEENLIIIALEKKKKPRFKLFKPLGPSALEIIPKITETLASISKYPVQIVCLDNESLSAIKKNDQLKVKNIKEFNYYIYDLSQLRDLSGNKWKNVRQKIANFNKNYPKLKTEKLSPDNYRQVIHFIGAWRRYLLNKRNFSYSNLEKNKFAAEYYSTKNDFKNIWSVVFRLAGRVVAFQLLYRLGKDSAAHAIGLADTDLKGLSEFTQVHIWKELAHAGIKYINDGPSWRPGLDRYKRKFNPMAEQQIFECKISCE